MNVTSFPIFRHLLTACTGGLILLVLVATSHAAPPSGCGEDTKSRLKRIQSCLGKPIRDMALTSCPKSVCLDKERRQKLLALSGLRGKRATLKSFKRSLKRLMATGYFRDIVPQCAPNRDGIDLALEVCSNTFIRKVKIRGNRYLHRREIRKRIFLRSGTILNVDPKNPMANSRIRSQAQTIRSLFAKEGLTLGEDNCGPDEKNTDTRKCGMRFIVTRLSPTTVGLTIQILEQERKRIRVIQTKHIAGHSAPSDKLHCPKVKKSAIRNMLGIAIGDVITKRKTTRLQRKVKAYFQSIGYRMPDVKVTSDGDPLVLSVKVKTSQCWVIRVWERNIASSEITAPSFRSRDPIQGNAIPQGQGLFTRSIFEPWRKVLPFGNSGVFDEEEAARGVKSIRALTESKGFLFADVKIEHRVIPAQLRGNMSVQGTIDYFITTNRERRIQGMTFNGRKSFRLETLTNLVSTESYNFFGSSGYLQIARLFADLKKIQDHYRDHGFYEMRYRWRGRSSDKYPKRVFKEEITGKNGKIAWLTWIYTYKDRGFRIRKRPRDTIIYIDIDYTEGNRTTIRAVSVANTGPITPPQFLKELNLKPKKPFGLKALTKAVKRVERAYRSRGYAQAKVITTCEAYEPEPVDFCLPFRVRSKIVDLRFTVRPGPRIVVGEIFWRGNFQTIPHIITRDYPKPGTAYSQRAVAEATRKLRNLGIFNSVQVKTIGLKENPPRKKVALVIAVEEAPARFIDLSAGFRTIDRPDLGKVPPIIGTILGQSITATDRFSTGSNRSHFLTIPDLLLVLEGQYLDQNFLGRAVTMRLPIEYGFSATHALRLLRTLPRWTISRFLGTNLKLDFTGRAIFTDKVSEVKDFSEYSAGITGTYKISRTMSIAAELSGGTSRFIEPDRETEFELFVRTSLRWRWDNQDNPLHPTKGFALTAAVSAIVANELEGETVEFRRFIKWDLTLRGALKLRAGIILALYLRYGGSDANEIHPLPDQERFTLGRSNGLRGFGDKTVGRYDQTGNLIRPVPLGRLDFGGNVLVNLNLELRVPVNKRSGIWAVAFFDTGALAADHRQLYFWESFRSAVGIGFRYLLLNQIPIRVDLGFALGDLRCEKYQVDSQGANVGCDRTEDRATLHFGFLYPF